MDTHTLGSHEILLPNYMNSLIKHEVDQASQSELASTLVIAAGVNPSDSSLVIVTAQPEVRSVKPTGRLVPSTAKPVLSGRGVEITFHNVEGVYLLDSKLTIDKSESCLDGSHLLIGDTYVCDIESKRQEAEDDPP